ncbi:MAG: histidinol-phosphate transaminase [Bacteroidetes bacterium]|nr:histidinol-phosphate transaminase [Bacteroidota bacterium]
MKIPYRSALDTTPEYIPGKSIDEVIGQYGARDVIKLASNENALGPPQSSIAAAAKVLKTMGRYPDPYSSKLKSQLAQHDGLPENNILISHGLEEMIPALCRAYINPGDISIQPELTFIKYEIGVKIMEGVCIKVPMKNFEIDMDGLLNAVTEDTKIVWLCNPNNPTGTYIGEKQLVDFLSKIPENVLVVHDETYREFTTAPDYPRKTVELLKNYQNLILMRSFSKAYGLAGFRCGYMLADAEIVRQVMKVREIFSVSEIAAAAASAALEDTLYLEQVLDVIHQGKDYLMKQLRTLPGRYITVKDTQANFIYIETSYANTYIFEEMQKKGVIIRPIGSHGLRVTIGLYQENIRFIESFKSVLKDCEHIYHKSGATA